MLNKKEILRQLIHFSGILVLLIPESIEVSVFGTYLIVAAIVGYIFARGLEELAKRPNRGVTDLAVKGTYKIINLAERERAFTLQGALMFFLGIGMALIIFPRNIAFLSVIALAIGDSVSTMVGIHLGSHKVWFNKKKSWEGSLAGFAAILIFSGLFLSGLGTDLIFTAALVGSVVELMSRKIDDNISIPLFTGLTLYLMTSVFGII